MANLTFFQSCHLARRSGFAATPSQVELLMSADSMQNAVTALVGQESQLYMLPEWHNMAPFGRSQDSDVQQQRTELRKSMSRELKAWWIQQMSHNSAPLVEKMTLFWANHFTSSLSKVKWPPAMLTQNLLFRQHALGSFRDLLKSVLRDPAMLVYLDNANSNKESPNENLARELLELFTLGEGEYSESDVKEMARALTGASVNRRTGEYQFKQRIHDPGEKTIFGETANFGPEDLADLILRQPSASTFIVQKLWVFFIDNHPQQDTISALAQSFIDSDYDLADLVGRLFMTDEFWASRGEQIKSPAELIVGSRQLFEVPVHREQHLVRLFKELRQDLFEPPNVKGWPDGFGWYSTQTVPVRETLSLLLARRATLGVQAEFLLATSPVAALPEEDAATYLTAVVFDPAYQVT